MLLENARIEEVIVEQGVRKDQNGQPLLGSDGQVQKWTRRSIRVKQDTRAGDYGVINLTRAVEENESVMRDLVAGAVVTVEVGMAYREYNGRYYNDLSAWRVDIVKPACF